MRPNVERVVLVGPTRSGTTLVQRLLCEHTGLTTFPETHVFLRGFRRGVTGWVFDAVGFRQAMSRVQEAIGGPPTPTIQSGAPPGRTARAVVAWFDEVAVSRGAVGWLEKTPADFRRLGLIRTALGSSGVVMHVVRRPSDSIASRVWASAEWGRPRGWLHSSAHWLGAFAAMQLGCRRFGDGSICFEEVLSDPHGAIERAATEAGLDPAPGGARRDAAAEMAVDAEPWRHRSLEPPSPRSDALRSGSPGAWLRLVLGGLDMLWRVTYRQPLERRSARRSRPVGCVLRPDRPRCVVVNAHDPQASYGRPACYAPIWRPCGSWVTTWSSSVWAATRSIAGGPDRRECCSARAAGRSTADDR